MSNVSKTMFCFETCHSFAEDDGEPHDCIAAIAQVCNRRPDLSVTKLSNSDVLLFVGGSSSKNPQTGQNHMGYRSVSHTDVLESGRLPDHWSAQAAEVFAPIEPDDWQRRKHLLFIQQHV